MKCFVVDETVKDDIIERKKPKKKDEENNDNIVTKMFKIKLNPTKHQKELLRKFKGTERVVFNLTKNIIDKEGMKSKFELRNQVVTKVCGINNVKKEFLTYLEASESFEYKKKKFDSFWKENKGWIENKLLNPLFKGKEWMEETPKVIRQQAAFSCHSTYKSAFSNYNAGNIEQFNIRYKSKKNERTWTLGIEKQLKMIGNKLIILPEYLSEVRYYKRCLKGIPHSFLFNEYGTPKCDSYIHYNRNKDYYLLVPYKVEKKISISKKSCSGDPGIRKFLTVQSPEDKEGYFLGVGCSKKLEPLFFKLDDIVSRLDKDKLEKKHNILILNKRERKKLKQQRRRLEFRIKNMKIELHAKIANFLTKKYSIIILPHFESRKLSQSGLLKSKVVRNMMTLAHCEFLTKLKNKCKERGNKLCIVPEEYTTKTCGNCGTLNDIGSSEVFKCSNCNLRAERDLHAARNEYIKSINIIKIELVD